MRWTRWGQYISRGRVTQHGSLGAHGQRSPLLASTRHVTGARRTLLGCHADVRESFVTMWWCSLTWSVHSHGPTPLHPSSILVTSHLLWFSVGNWGYTPSLYHPHLCFAMECPVRGCDQDSSLDQRLSRLLWALFQLGPNHRHVLKSPILAKVLRKVSIARLSHPQCLIPGIYWMFNKVPHPAPSPRWYLITLVCLQQESC